MNYMGYLIIVFSVQSMFSMIFTWLAIKVSYVRLDLREILIIVVISTLSALVPYIGLPLSFVLFIFLVMRFSGCSGFDAAGVAIITKLFVFAGFMLTMRAVTDSW